MPPQSPKFPSKAPTAVVGRLLARLLGVSGDIDQEDIPGICAAFDAAGDYSYALRGLLHGVTGLYPWMTDIPTEVMNDRAATSTLLTEVIALPGSILIAKDKRFSAAESLWVILSDPTPETLVLLGKFPHRGLTRAIPLEDALVRVVAIQLQSCFQ